MTEKIGNYSTTEWSRLGKSIEGAVYDDSFRKQPTDYERLDGGKQGTSEKILDFQPQSDTIKSKGNQTDGNQNSGNHGHKGVQGQVGGSAPSSGGEELTRFSTSGDRMKISSDLAVKASKSGKTMFTIKAGREIERIYSFAGKGSDQNLVVSGLLAKRLGGDPNDWSHKAGFALTTDTSGKETEREIHWFEHDEIGQTGFKVKFRNPGGGGK